MGVRAKVVAFFVFSSSYTGIIAAITAQVKVSSSGPGIRQNRLARQAGEEERVRSSSENSDGPGAVGFPDTGCF